MDWLTKFPTMDGAQLTALKKAIDEGFRNFTRAYGESFETLFQPLQSFMIWTERLLTQSPWPLVLIGILAIAWLASRSIKIVIGSAAALLAIGYFGMWDDTMKTIAMIVVATLTSLVIGIPLGIAVSRWSKLRAVVVPTLDVMQTMPSFVYLIPVVMLLGIGKVPGLIAVVIYAVPPVIRLTDLGIRLVDADVLEAADAYGASGWQRLANVQLPLALPTIMAGVNQTIMMALSMVVVASMIGVQGLGQPVLRAISGQYFTLGVFNGFAIVGVAIIFDRVSQALGRRLQRHREVVHG
ncbi:ABC transporter permease [Methylobrevis albus]|uniref:Proline/glycine betaine ABC transporter permease n=1 Tax=Methylobrevis albus TaxID=2793297 RepID=A0A931MWL8_9HYPH|nr:proline/glycine betaine ABC transporter permease [Methylobrevis albus]MBH0237323.1 proline/glycine betaine ABC transporter permease [Methylobrevis albus]